MTLLMKLGVLLTFGAIIPPVALAMAVSIMAVVCTARVELQRFVQSAIAMRRLQCLSVIDAECAGVGKHRQMQRAVVIIVCYCCAFYALFLFDTLGDAEGFEAAAWVLVVVPLAPAVVYSVHYICTGTRYADSVETEDKSVEMKSIRDDERGAPCIGDADNMVDRTDIVNVLHRSV